MNKKALIAVLFSILLIGGGLYFFTNQKAAAPSWPDENAGVSSQNDANKQINEAPQDSNTASTTTEIDISNWKMYRNEEYGFEVEYPAAWWVNKRGDNLVVFSSEKRESAVFENKKDILVLDIQPPDDEAHKLSCVIGQDMKCRVIKIGEYGEAIIQFTQTGHVIAETILHEKIYLDFSLMCDAEDWSQARNAVPYCVTSDEKVEILAKMLSTISF